MSLALRSRTPWEALDLGVAMYRQLAFPMYRAVLPAILAIILPLLLICWRWPMLAMMLVWWLKPVYERIILHFYSQAIFGSHPGWRETLWALPKLLRHSGTIYGLTIGRVSLSRTFRLPIRQLEHQSGKACRDRQRVLDREGRSQSIWMGIVLVHMEAFLTFAILMVLIILWPDSMVSPEWSSIWEPITSEETSWQWLSNGLWLTAILITEPLYVASGFALYLNRRSQLEGWDIELTFRRLTHRNRGSHHLRQVMSWLLVGTLLCLPLMQSGTAYANPPAKPSATPSQAKQTIDNIVARPEFGHYEHYTAWRLKPRINQWLREWLDTDKRSKHDASENDPHWLLGLLELLASSMRWLVWLVGGLLIALAVAWLLRHVRFEAGKPSWRKRMPPAALFGLAITPESLPAHPGQAAQTLAAQGKLREALSLLYRASLSSLVHDYQLPVEPGDTERDCTLRSRALISVEAHHYFNELVTAWQHAAYGHNLPALTTIESLCTRWASYFLQRETSE
ncbi:hypothetical protein [Chitinivorax sp. B]|uniref:hypothetical protein n=1 Tax=Chitinivorax sp. B TaxID=2502235 RepID=UPI0010F6E253|nr:hypothetical protein [Chitinivorax sp. B]